MVKSVSQARRVKVRALESSAMLLAVMIAGPAYAQCTPDPTQANSTTTCTGTDTNGLQVTTSGTTVDVAAGAKVTNGSGPAIGIAITSSPSTYYDYSTLTVSGTVDGGGQAGVLLTRSNSRPYSDINLSMKVAAGGTVSGANGVAISSPSFGNGYTRASIDNSGTITGTSGYALQAGTSRYAGFSSIINRAGGTIGAIGGAVGTLDNAGTIDAGARSAVEWSDTYNYAVYGSTVTNSGTITAATDAATLANMGYTSLTNSGTISNTGTGAAVTGTTSPLTVTNASTGTISGAGGIAIRTIGSFNVTNAGTIIGNVESFNDNAFYYYNGSTLDNSQGTITGNVRFGGTNDTLVVGYADGAIKTGVSGTIDGGGGTDTMRVRFTSDASLTALGLPTGFEQLVLSPDAKMNVTLAAGFVSSGALQISGSGTVTNNAALTGAGTVVRSVYVSGGSPSFVNTGSITATSGQGSDYAVALDASGNRFENSGTITAASNGVSYSSQGTFVNSGTITAAGTAVSLFGSSFSNTGTIRSTSGAGAILSGSSGASWTNSGRIEGVTAGVRLSSDLTNSGTITATGTGVSIASYGRLLNQAGGVVTGGGRAIGPDTSYGYVFNASVANAGTINGDVGFGSNPYSSGSNSNSYIALPGGVLNGNLTLAGGDLFVTELTGSATGRYAGVTGTVTANGANLRYRVRTDSSATLGSAAGFANVGYELFDKATLTLTGAASTQTLSLAGQGSVDLTQDITTTNASTLSSVSRSIAPGESAASNALTITSRGALSWTAQNRSDYYYYYNAAAVSLGSADTFINAGTITARDQRSADMRYGIASAISNATSVTNSGTIALDGLTGIRGVTSIVNSGSIVQAANSQAATAASNFGSLVNSGTIEVAGTAVLVDYYYYGNGLRTNVENSGRIASTGGVAIAQSSGYYGIVINNLAGGTIAGGSGQFAIQSSGGQLTNAGTIIGNVDLGYSAYSGGQSYSSAVYTAAGGTLTGNLRFSAAADLFVETDGATGVTGTIDGGNGTDIFRHALTRSGTATLGRLGTSDMPNILNFEREDVQAIGADTVVTVASPVTLTSIGLLGDGQIVNTANLDGSITLGDRFSGANYTRSTAVLTSLTNQAIIKGSVSGAVASFANSGTIGGATLTRAAVTLSNSGDLAFANSGSILTNGDRRSVALTAGNGAIVATNDGTLTQGLSAIVHIYINSDVTPTDAPPALQVAVTNRGTIARTFDDRSTVAIVADDYRGVGGTVRLDNSGTIAAGGIGSSAVAASFYSDSVPDGVPTGAQAIIVANSGTIRATGGGKTIADASTGTDGQADSDTVVTQPAVALLFYGSGSGSTTATVANAATGVIEVTSPLSTAIGATGVMLDVTNAGTIRGGAGITLAANDQLAQTAGTPYMAGAIQSVGASDDRIVNTGTIIGSVALGGGSDRIENYGRIEGDVFLGAGDDSFLHAIGATLVGTVDGGDGTDTLIVDSTGGGTLNGDQFINFERFSQIGTGNLTYTGDFRVETIGVAGGTITVAAGETLTSTGATTITGTDAAETVVNKGTITGAVALEGGDDRFVEGAGSQVAGGVDGGAGVNTYVAQLAGDRSGLGQRSNFQDLAVTGNGTLTLGLDQSFDTVTLAGTGLDLTLAGHGVGAVTGSDAGETLRVDGDIASIALGAGNDLVALGTTGAAGRYDGGAGSDTLRFTATAPVVLSGTATGFETVSVAGNALTVTGTLGSAGAPLALEGGDLALTIAPGGTLAGIVDLGAGNDALRFSAGSVLQGSVAGGAGSDRATLVLAGDRTLAAGTLTGFELLATEGSGTLTLTGAQAYDRVQAATDLTVAAGGSLTAGQLAFTGGDQRLTIAGGFTGAVDGGAGTDRIALSGGTAAVPVAFTDVANVEALAMTGGYATVSGQAAFGAAALTGGRLVGLAGSTMTAGQFQVGQGATFGSAGTVNGNVAVAGILSPGASPGTMTVNGNVALAAGSLSLFELTPTVSDKLVVNGAVTIADGSTLQIVSSGALRPGASYDLIVASGGISGGYTNVQKPADLFGFLVQRADRLSLLGQFQGDARFSPQVSRSIDYANATLSRQPATSTLFAALPALLTGSGASNPQGFAQVTPEAYASATQIGVDNALTLTQAARGPAFAGGRDEAGAFTFGQGVGQWHRLGADRAQGASAAQTRGYGLLAGLGYGDRQWMVGAFGGWMNTRQSVAPLGAFTKADGLVAGVHGRYTLPGGLGFAASILYDGAKAQTRRALPGMGANGATGRYDLHGLVSDLSVQYVAELPQGWSLTPRAGLTYLRTTRAGVAESGGSPFALTVARDRHVAGFADAGVTFGRSDASDAAFRPFVTLGARYQIEGRGTAALGGYAGGGLGLTAYGASRAPLVGTVTGGVAYRFASGLDLYSTASAQTGRDDHQETITTGLRLRF